MLSAHLYSEGLKCEDKSSHKANDLHK